MIDHTITFTRLPIPNPPFYFSATGYGMTECGRDSGEAFNNLMARKAMASNLKPTGEK